MADLLLRLLDRLQPPGGWGAFVLTLTACLMPAAALIQSKVGVDVEALLVLTALATIAGLLLARSRLSAARAAALGALVGVALTLIAVGRLLPPPSLLWTEASYAFDWVRRWPEENPAAPPSTAWSGILSGPLIYPSRPCCGWGWRRWKGEGTCC